jgi:hypothetical protein
LGVVNKAADLAVFEDGGSLVDHVLHVGLGLVKLLVGDELLHPTRIQVDEVTRRATHVGEMLDGEAQAPRPGGTHHQPVVVSGEMLVADLLAELAVVGLVVLPTDALLGHPRGPARFENVERPAGVGLGHPDLGLEVTQPFVLEVRELDQVGGGVDLGTGIPAGLGRPVEPKRAARFGRKMPLNDFAQLRIKLGLRRFRCWSCHSLGVVGKF